MARVTDRPQRRIFVERDARLIGFTI